MNSVEQVRVSQFELTKADKNRDKITNISKQIEKRENVLTYRELYDKVAAHKKLYTMHKYQVYNDKHHWPSTLLVPKNLFLSFLWTTQKTWHKCTNMSLSSHILASNSIHYIALLGLNI